MNPILMTLANDNAKKLAEMAMRNEAMGLPQWLVYVTAVARILASTTKGLGAQRVSIEQKTA